jgi:antitoxin (DNA-binding transcriptional repressor) of toxin-antitoxin stability system
VTGTADAGWNHLPSTSGILALLDDIAAGDQVEITKHGRTVARLVPATGPHALKGSLAGVAMSAAKDEELFATGAARELS